MELFFPFENMRDVQMKMINELSSAIGKKKHVIAHAPTGIGKTAASIAASLTYAMANQKTVIFLTPKHTQHQIAVETLKKIKEKHGLNIIATDFIGKRWMCLVPSIDTLSSREFTDYCNDMRKEERCVFYNKLWKKNELTKQAKELIERLKKESPLNVEQVINIASREQICPYYISAELAKQSKFIIADYYHIFHPNVRKVFLNRIKKELEDCIIIIDEAQNLPNRIRDVLSSKISNFSIAMAIKEARKFEQAETAKYLEKLAEVIEELASKLGEHKEIYVRKDDFVDEVYDKLGKNFEEIAGDFLLIGEHIRIENKRSFVGSIGAFMLDWYNTEDGYTGILKQTKWKDKDIFELNLSCLDPGVSSEEIFKKCHSAVLMSGTLNPTSMYRDILRLGEDRTICVDYPNPFSKKNRLAMIVPDTTTKFTRRNPEEYKKIAEWCAKISNEIPGNVAVFFPSYYLRDEIMKFFEHKSRKTIFLERNGMKKREKAALLNEFKEYADAGAVFMGVVSGSFGEGVDLPGKFLNGVVVVGIPLETPDLETKALINYYDKLFNDGWNYGYVYPAMNRTIQACGRVVRSETDRGAVVLLDERFIGENYFKCLPIDWGIIVTKEPIKRIKDFFSV